MKKAIALIVLALSLVGCNDSTGVSTPGLVDGEIIEVQYREHSLYCIDGYHALSCDFERFYRENPDVR